MWAYTSIGRGGWAFPVDKCELIEKKLLIKGIKLWRQDPWNELEREVHRGRELRER